MSVASTPNRTPHLLYLSRYQFGYMLPTLHNVTHLRRHFRVTFVCLDTGRPKIALDDVDVNYVAAKDRWRRGVKYVSACIRSARRHRPDVCLIEYFPGAVAVRQAIREAPVVLDIRTSNVSPSRLMRMRGNLQLRMEASAFRHICVISEGVRRLLRLPPAKTHILPLGAQEIQTAPKSFSDQFRLLYLGTLTTRRIHETVVGLKRFLDAAVNPPPITYDIVGDGATGEREQIDSLSRALGLSDVVTTHGFIHHHELAGFWERCNVGVSNIPLTPYFDVQPPTKTFEYLLAGMPVIATRTTENRRVVGPANGILTSDNPDSFAQGLKDLLHVAPGFSSERIRSSVRDYRWDRIIDENMAPYLRRVCGIS